MKQERYLYSELASAIANALGREIEAEVRQ